MRPIAVAALTALLACAGFAGRANAQPADPVAPPAAESGMAIEWQVRNRFRLFRREADFQRHVTAKRARQPARRRA